MGTPTRTSLLLDLQSTLEGITVANGYKTTVDTVEPYARGRDDAKPGEMPYIAFGIKNETYAHDVGANMRVVGELVVIGVLDASGLTWGQASDAVNDLIDDIIVAMATNHNNATYNVMAKLKSSLTDEWDPDRGSTVCCVLEYDIVYNREITAS